MSLKQRLSSKWVSVLLFVAVGWMVSEAAGVWLRARTVELEVDRMSDRIAELERDIARREELLDEVQHPDWLAYQARLRLNYKNPDEQVVVVYKKENADIIGAVASTSGQGGSRSLFRRLREWFAGIVQW